MANVPKNDPSEMQGQRGQNVQQGIGSPISNEAYNVIAALQAKLEGLEAYRKYAKDNQSNLWQELTTIETEAVERLVSELEQIVKNGKLRLTAPGRGH
jgi:hypothetical protein